MWQFAEMATVTFIQCLNLHQTVELLGEVPLVVTQRFAAAFMFIVAKLTLPVIALCRVVMSAAHTFTINHARSCVIARVQLVIRMTRVMQVTAMVIILISATSA